ncbi:MAG: hypothetical protein ABI663_08490 [Chryseolinea sp.]
MQNLSDEDIDKIFKQAAEQQQAKFDSADWDDMTSRLDAAAKRPWSNYYTWTGGLVVLGVVIWLGWMISTPVTTKDAQTSKSSLQTEATIMDKQSANDFQASSSARKAVNPQTLKEKDEVEIHSTSSESNVSHLLTETISDKAKHISENQPTSSIEKLSPSASNVAANHSVSTMSSHAQVNSAKSIGSQKNSIGTGSELSLDKNQESNHLGVSHALNTESATSIQKEEVTLSNSQTDQGGEGTNVGNANEHQTAGEGKIKTAIDSADRITIQEEKTKLEEKTDQKDSVTRKSVLSRFAIKATVAPDFSSDRFKTTDKMGLNYGLIVEYFLIDKFSVSAGALWSRKFYSAKDVEYSGYHADRAYGDCRMWDIPLNVNYYFSPSKSYSFFASAGLSSYLMNEENYDFEVDTNQGTNTYPKKYVNENKEWFKTLNVSVGLQKQINTRLVIQVEPFMKVPLAGVGEGNISLASFGSFFSVRYHFLSKLK